MARRSLPQRHTIHCQLTLRRVAIKQSRSRHKTELSLSSRRETGGATKTPKVKRVGGSKEERTKEEKAKTPKVRDSDEVRTRNSKANKSAEEISVEASETKEKKEKKGMRDYLS
ncbi:hypothetical protein PMAYCL1PPCAC_29937, partial [Pristionchus mayeri]